MALAQTNFIAHALEDVQRLPYGEEVGPVDALVLAKSGLERIGLGNRIFKIFAINEMCPAVG
jgi:hydroxymethylbilane synthase